MISRSFAVALAILLSLTIGDAQSAAPPPQVSALPYCVVPDFFQLPNEWHFGEVSGVAIDSQRHIFVFQRGVPCLCRGHANGNVDPETLRRRTIVFEIF